jgi:murein DD-endopeptidase MepM/ murein hydrolase activator NlpD
MIERGRGRYMATTDQSSGLKRPKRRAAVRTLAAVTLLILGATAAASTCSMPGLPEKLSKPTDGPLTSGFGMRFHPLLNMRRLHDGLDYAAPAGTAVRAVEDGVVTIRNYRGDDGNTVEVDHGDGLTTVYSHMRTFNAPGEGECIRKGDLIGPVGCMGL